MHVSACKSACPSVLRACIHYHSLYVDAPRAFIFCQVPFALSSALCCLQVGQEGRDPSGSQVGPHNSGITYILLRACFAEAGW
jgi:hypothetical protein